MGTKKTHAFVRNLEQFVAPRWRTIGKLVRRFLNFFYYLELSLSLFCISRNCCISFEFLLSSDISPFFNLESNNNGRHEHAVKLLLLVKATRFVNLLGIGSTNVRVVYVAEETRRRQLQYFLRCERGWAWLTLWQPVVKCSTLPCVLSSIVYLYTHMPASLTSRFRLVWCTCRWLKLPFTRFTHDESDFKHRPFNPLPLSIRENDRTVPSDLYIPLLYSWLL